MPGWCLAVAFVVLVIAAPRAGAINASIDPVVVVQPDGTRIRVQLRGDEWNHWYEDESGYAIVLDGGTWRYASLDAEGRLVATRLTVGSTNPQAAGLTRGLHPRLSDEMRQARAMVSSRVGPGEAIQVNPIGTVKNLVVLCLFSDHTVAANGRAVSAYDSLFNQANSTGFNAPTGSVRDYYQQASYGILTIQSTVVAWVTLPNTEAYYGNGKNGLPFGANAAPYPTNAAGMVQAALGLVDATVDFGQFDADNDGFIDAITIIHSGYGGEQNGNGANAIWSHKYSLSGMNGGGVWTSADNNASSVKVKVDLYHTEPARWGTAGSSGVVRVGVIAHELGHFFGLPDLYDTDNSSAGIGNWCLMGNSWGWDQTQQYPPLPSAWCRLKLGWITPINLPNGVVSLPQVATSPAVGRINAGYPSGVEYLLVENRQPVGFDQQIPQGGLAVWHIDESVGSNTPEGFPGQAGWPENGNHYMVALLPADGRYDLEKNTNRGDGGDLFRNVVDIALSETTTPGTDRYSGALLPTANEIGDVGAPGSSMLFRYRPATWVQFGYSGPQSGTFSEPFSTLAGGTAATPDNAIVICKPGTSSERPTLNRIMRYKSYQGTATVGQ
jgi:M6 family metalloprotease-like protein